MAARNEVERQGLGRRLDGRGASAASERTVYCPV